MKKGILVIPDILATAGRGNRFVFRMGAGPAGVISGPKNGLTVRLNRMMREAFNLIFGVKEQYKHHPPAGRLCVRH